MISEWMTAATALVVAATGLLNAIRALRTEGGRDGNQRGASDQADG
jgi:hypothetical protein